MTDPIVQCRWCDAKRNVMSHQRAEHPPTAAKKWLRNHCRNNGKPCDFFYTAGHNFHDQEHPRNADQGSRPDSA